MKTFVFSVFAVMCGFSSAFGQTDRLRDVLVLDPFVVSDDAMSPSEHRLYRSLAEYLKRQEAPKTSVSLSKGPDAFGFIADAIPEISTKIWHLQHETTSFQLGTMDLRFQINSGLVFPVKQHQTITIDCKGRFLRVYRTIKF